jgi:kynureninase
LNEASIVDFRYTPEYARDLDAQDPLREARDRFHIPRHHDGSEQIYFCGNSLGLQPKSTADYVNEVLDDWKTFAVEGHFLAAHPWLPYHEFLTEQSAEIVGALPDEVVCMNSLSVNLHLLMVSFYRPDSKRYKILIEEKAFPSDSYAVASQARFHGYNPDDAIVTIAPREGETMVRTEDIAALLDRESDAIALILLGGVQYYSGQLFDMEEITQLGHKHGCVVGFDLAHAAGNVPLSMHDWGVDFAAWCSYKYLNAGPGSTAGAYIHERHLKDNSIPRFEGWWGQNKETRFDMGPVFDPIPNAEAWQLSNPAILPMAALRASLDVFDDYGMDALREKSVKLTGYLYELLHSKLHDTFTVLSSPDEKARGCQLSIRVNNNGRAVFDALSDAGIICDWREPDVIRIAPVPLYNSFSEVCKFVQIFHSMLGS